MRARLGDDTMWETGSAGVFAPDGAPPSKEGVQVLKELKINSRKHRSRPLTRELVDQATLVVVMTREHQLDVLRMFPDLEGRVHMLTSFSDTHHAAVNIPDPIGLPLSVYRTTRDTIDSAVSDLILYMKDRWGLQPSSKETKGVMKVAIGSDHGGFDLKQHMIALLDQRGIEVEDVGAFNKDSSDYPDFAGLVAGNVSEGIAEQGILVCTTGIGMSIAANKYPRIRAALCTTPGMAALARTHNDANVLTLGSAQTGTAEAESILNAWLGSHFEQGGRHTRRVGKIQASTSVACEQIALEGVDHEIYTAIRNEAQRQVDHLELIASENYASRAVREAQGSVMTDKYAEGYPRKRYYDGCQFVDTAEEIALDRAKQLFGAEHANVQPHCGSSANMGVYFSVLEPGDTILAMSLDHGGHLTHGHSVNFSGRFYHIVQYGVGRETETIDYDQIRKLAEEHRPKIILAGASAYSRLLDFKQFRQIADSVGAYLLVDMAHIAGLVAAGCHPSPVPLADFVTTTTHKTLRGPRGGMILCKERFAKDIDRQIFPGIQGGPLMHAIAAKAVCFHEALQPEFKAYQEQVVRNAKQLAETLASRGLRIVSGGTDNHLMLVDLTPAGISGKVAASALDLAGITANKNSIPFDAKSPFVTSGVRLGTPAVTTRGMKEPEMETIGELIGRVIRDPEDEKTLAAVKFGVQGLTTRFPLP